MADQPINLSSLIPRDTGWLINGVLDTRYRNATTGTHHITYLNAAEIDLQHPITYKNTREGTFFFQLIGENPPDHISGKQGDVQIGEAYVTYRLPILTQTDSTAYLKVGQFTLPFGLMAVYDTHLQIMQTLYPEAIGERMDEGIGVEGRFYGVLDYRFAVTAGVGPNHVQIDPNRVVTFRLGRLFATPYGTFNFGGSLLSGRLPVAAVDPMTGFAPTLPASGRIMATDGFESKTRIAGDATWTYQSVTARGEAMTGADDSNSTRVLGYFVEGEYRFAPGLTAVIARKYWDYGVNNSNSGDNAIGLNVTFGKNLVVRTLYEEQRDVPINPTPTSQQPIAPTHLRHVFTVQLLARF
ncbi:MAG TPA: hypothetical protein VFW40_00095 [Capsulimonadaceae bacterium]|nr:hypothetical protein [Capsulimonadaceae bacterium]